MADPITAIGSPEWWAQLFTAMGPAGMAVWFAMKWVQAKQEAYETLQRERLNDAKEFAARLLEVNEALIDAVRLLDRVDRRNGGAS